MRRFALILLLAACDTTTPDHMMEDGDTPAFVGLGGECSESVQCTGATWPGESVCIGPGDVRCKYGEDEPACDGICYDTRDPDAPCWDGMVRCPYGDSTLCTTVDTDRNNCGACDNECGMAGPVHLDCVAGSCCEWDYVLDEQVCG